MKVALFVTCLADGLFPEVGKATVALLERLGCTVEFPAAQTCCGQMHWNTGYQTQARALAQHWVAAFRDPSYDAIVAPSGSCAAMVRHHYPRMAEQSRDPTFAAELAPRTYELSEFLIDVLGVEDVGATYAHRVTYHPTCHSLRLLRVGDKPLRLLRNVRGLDLVELPAADACCGFGGTFAMKNADTSAAMLLDKMDAIARTRADVCTAGDASCLMHIGGGLARLRTAVRTVHLAEILASTATTT
jgi:L-lactate dehydrogenase complex protein LldE